MQTAKYVVFRYLTHADMFNIYKPSGMETGGGGQSYIDFPTARVPVATWQRFFRGARDVSVSSREIGPSWTFPIHSIGGFGTQQLTVYQRRLQSVCIASQKITSRKGNRVYAWRPENGFPAPANPEDREHQPSAVVIFIVRTGNDEFWAGWFHKRSPCKTIEAQKILDLMLLDNGIKGNAGFLDCMGAGLEIDEGDSKRPFLTIGNGGREYPTAQSGKKAKQEHEKQTRVKDKAAHTKPYSERKIKNDDDLISELFNEDAGAAFSDDAAKTRMQIVRVRNVKAARVLKRLYKGQCQISGDKYAFQKIDGAPYCEAHHLIPLGAEGDDSPFNIIIVSPLLHRMLHYADVRGVDLSRITTKNTLDILINGECYTIRWHPKHAAAVIKAQQLAVS
jgi:5-methylcytosine-specific restriction protein A